MYWDSVINNDEDNNGEISVNTKGSYSKESREFIEGMAKIYNKDSYKKDIILEMYFTDLDETYQLILKKDECVVKTSDFSKYTARIDTALSFNARRYKSLSDTSTMPCTQLIIRKIPAPK